MRLPGGRLPSAMDSTSRSYTWSIRIGCADMGFMAVGSLSHIRIQNSEFAHPASNWLRRSSPKPLYRLIVFHNKSYTYLAALWKSSNGYFPKPLEPIPKAEWKEY